MAYLFCATADCEYLVEADATSVQLASGCPRCGSKAFVSHKPSLFVDRTPDPTRPDSGDDGDPSKTARMYDYRKAALSSE